MFRMLRHFLIGKPLHNEELSEEKLPKWKALAIFSSDALSSVAYGPEQILLVLSIPGLVAYGFLGPIALAILALLFIVTISYSQVAKVNPGGGGSYSVAIKNLGEIPALVAASALFADYTLTVAVSVSAGTVAIISAFPQFAHHEVMIDLLVLLGILMIVNLRGVRESSTAFVFPTYAFILGILMLIISGVYQALTGVAPIIPQESLQRQFDWTMLGLILRAFANGCSSMTGVEAISNGVPMFKKPEVKNAQVTTYLMSGLLGLMFLGITFLLMHYHINPLAEVTALSQLAEITLGRGWIYYYIQITTMLILYLAANTSFNGLPPLLSILAKDGYMPRYLGARGERLNFSNGIILLTIIAAILIVLYQGNIEHLISLYAIGVFLSFTIAQAGMVVHWHREKTSGWLPRAMLNAFGAIVTGIIVLIIGFTKFIYGAWLVVIFIPFMVKTFKQIKSHYMDMAEQLHLPVSELNPDIEANLKIGKNIVIMPIASPTLLVAETMKYAKSISTDILVINVVTDEATGQKNQAKWQNWNPGVELITIYSPYRMVNRPILNFINEVASKKNPEDFITVLIPEFETKKWWHRVLHNQTGFILRTLLILKENVIVTTIPFHLKK
jgi:amino acid transporter